ncbi:MAG: DUF2845 domain-containing protein [Pseudomonadota bacterium]
MRIALLTVGLALAVSAPQAGAAFRCDTELVERGMTPLEVAERCGSPVYEFGWIDLRGPGSWVRVDEWIYEPGPNRFRRLLTFENGRLVRIEMRAKPARSRDDAADY